MPYTSPHQKVITIHRKPLGNNFLGINNDNWKNAARILGAQAFLLYIYLASNKDDFKFALSPKAIHQEIGMPPSTFRDQLAKLESLGFLVAPPEQGNMYHFYEVPQHDTRTQSTNGALNSPKEKITAAAFSSSAHAQESTPKDIEIYINNKEDETNIPKGVQSMGSAIPLSIEEYKKLKNGFHF